MSLETRARDPLCGIAVQRAGLVYGGHSYSVGFMKSCLLGVAISEMDMVPATTADIDNRHGRKVEPEPVPDPKRSRIARRTSPTASAD